MSQVINTLDHAFALVLRDISIGARAVATFEQKKVQPESTQIELLSALIPVYGPEIVLLERLAFSAFGALAAALHTSGSPEKAAASTGVSPGLFQALEAFLQANPSLVAQAVSLVK